jgi:two-component system CheB/CheR fusion protein
MEVIKDSLRGSMNASRVRRKANPAVTPDSPPATADSDDSFPIVGIGASAGGLEAISLLLKHLPHPPGMAMVVVQHLAPMHPSALASLLSRVTWMPVSEARNNLRVEPNSVYVVPPNRDIALEERRLKVSPRRNSREVQKPIDRFLESLARQERDRAIGVILSGTGTDGTRGLQAIKAAGGITFAQAEKSAKYSGMPASAIAAGCVNFVLPPEQIAVELARIAEHPDIAPRAAFEEVKVEPRADEKAFRQILAILHQRTGVDFTDYRAAMLRLRIQRRMVFHKFESPQEYAEHLGRHATEFNELFNAILLHETGFFRDRSLFQALRKKLFPALLNNSSATEPIRVWVPGCSTGQELYSIAITLAEFMGERLMHRPVQFFGTDIHDGALEKARAGVYPKAIEADISPARLRRFFQMASASYRICADIRETCVFARHNLMVDPPFSRVDLISCRNLIISLGAALQSKAMSMFHYALKSNGILVLGASETVGRFSDLFALFDKKDRSYTKKVAHVPPAVTPGHRDVSLPVPAGTLQPNPSVPLRPSLTDLQQWADRILLTHCCPAGVIIDRHMEVLQFRGRTRPFLEHSRRAEALNLLSMARPGLRAHLRAAVTRAIERNVPVLRPGVRFRQNGYSVEATLEVIPYSVPSTQDKYYLVLFQPSAAVAEAKPGKIPRRRKDSTPQSTERAELTRLNKELAVTRKSLQSIIEEQETTMEELCSANEEITSSNEELQSTNEELETAREELQSTNEELTTLNDVLAHRNAELEQVNNDLRNVLGNVNIPIIVLSADLRIRRFTFVAEKLFGLIPGDVGRPIADINLLLNVSDLSKLAMEVINNLTINELEVKARNGHGWLARICPYKTSDNRIDGAIIAFMDVDQVKTNAKLARQSLMIADALINTMRHSVLLLDGDLSVQLANQAFYNTFQVDPLETLYRRVYDLGSAQWNIPKLRTLLAEILPRNSRFKEFEVAYRFPNIGQRSMVLNAHRLTLEGVDQALILLTIEPPAEKKPL